MHFSETIFVVLTIIIYEKAIVSGDPAKSRWSRESQSSQERRPQPPPPPSGGPFQGPNGWPRRGYGYYYTPSRPNMFTTPAPAADYCPCVRKEGSNECVTYDPRFQAATVEEAILNFPDLQMLHVSNGAAGNGQGGNPPTLDVNRILPISPLSSNGDANASRSLPGVVAMSRMGGANPANAVPKINAPPAPVLGASTGLCSNDSQCRDCSEALLSRLSNAGLLQNAELDLVSVKLGLDPAQRRKTQCGKYRFGQPIATASLEKGARNLPGAPNATADPLLDALVSQLQAKGEELWRKRQGQPENNGTARRKRQDSAGTLGQQYKIDCTKRGEPVEQGSTWVGLCNVCWAWRKLPSDYFPQYVNELVCDKDTKCMSGFGSCQQRFKSVDILRNTGSTAQPKWKPVTISVANYCDCEVESGSSMHNFVAA